MVINEDNFFCMGYLPHYFITGISDDDPLELPCLDGSGLERNHVNLIGIKFSSEIWAQLAVPTWDIFPYQLWCNTQTLNSLPECSEVNYQLQMCWTLWNPKMDRNIPSATRSYCGVTSGKLSLKATGGERGEVPFFPSISKGTLKRNKVDFLMF